MSAPYKVREFTAKSGNECRLKIYPIQPDGRQPIDATWEELPTVDDMTECDAWYADVVMPNEAALVNRQHAGFVLSRLVQDADERERNIAAQVGGSN